MYDFFKAHPSMVLSIAYIFVSVIGYIYNIGLFSVLGIDYIHYITIEDLVLAGIKEPVILVKVVGIGIGLLILFWVFEKWITCLEKKGKLKVKDLKRYRICFRIAGLFFLILVSFGAPYLSYKSGINDGKEKKESPATANIYLKDNKALKNVNIIGGSSAYLFLYDGQTEKSIVQPLDDVERITN